MLSTRRIAPLLVALALLARGLALQELSILSPAELYVQFPSPIANNPALFGSPPYGRGITGRVLYARDANTACSAFNSSAVPSWPLAPADPSQPFPTVILLVDRGGSTPSDPCTFVEKVYYAQQIGAAAVVVVNDATDPLPIMKSDGSALSTQITIPAMIINYQDGQALEQAALATGAGKEVVARLRWGLPHPDDRVEWSLWLTPTNIEAKSFLTALSTVSDALGSSALFTPQYFVKKTGCSRGAAYCAFDPIPNPNIVTDELVIDETVRQLCVYQVSNSTGSLGAWWKYMALFYDRCYTSFSEDCAKDILNSLWISAAAVDSCIANSWPTLTKNTLLDQQIALQAELGAWVSPTLYINSEPFAGSLFCSGTIKQSTCPPLNALCAGFLENQQPAMCDCDELGKMKDDCGVCGGNNGCKATPPAASGGMSWGTLAIIAVVVTAVGALVFFAYTRRQRRLARLEIDEILRRYVPLSEDGKGAAASAATGTGHHEFAAEDEEEEHIGHLSAGIGSALRSDSSNPVPLARPGPPPPPPSAGAVAAAAPKTAFAIGENDDDLDGDGEVSGEV